MSMSLAVVALLVAQIAGNVWAAPHIQGYRQDPYVQEETVAPCNNETGGTNNDVYDQRQNGTENYRINVNGVVVLLAPAETLLAAANLPDMGSELTPLKPPKATTVKPVTMEHSPEGLSTTVGGCEGGRCNHSNSTVRQRGKLKMMNNLIQLFRNLKDESQAIIN